jgi:hypothetical protein
VLGENKTTLTLRGATVHLDGAFPNCEQDVSVVILHATPERETYVWVEAESVVLDLFCKEYLDLGSNVCI